MLFTSLVHADFGGYTKLLRECCAVEYKNAS